MAAGDAVDVDSIADAILEAWRRDELNSMALSEDLDRAHRAIEVMVGKFRVVADSIRAGAATRQRALELAVEISEEGMRAPEVIAQAELMATWVATGVSADDDEDAERATS